MSGLPHDLDITQDDRAGHITLDRPQQRNALTLDMLRGIRHALEVWRSDPTVEVVLLSAAGGDGFCGGSDLGTLCKSPPGDTTYARNFWRETAQLASLMARYAKPIVVIIDGLAAGSGVGLAAHATYRVATERARFALPETAIGLVPDMGVTWLLSRAPAPAGALVALTGRALDAADAVYAGLADGMIASAALDTLRDRLSSPFGGPIERVLNGLVETPAPAKLREHAATVANAFAEPTIERIMAHLASMPEADATEAEAALTSRSPLALKLTLALMQRVKSMRTLEDALALEHRVLNRLFEHGELHEGVRARLIEGSRTPSWPIPELSGIDPVLVSSFFAPMLPGEDLRL